MRSKRVFHPPVLLLRRRTIGLITAVSLVILRGSSLPGQPVQIWGQSAAIQADNVNFETQGQAISIRVLNGHNGRPVHGEQLNVWFFKKPLEVIPLTYHIGAARILPPTTKDGSAVLQVPRGAVSLAIGSDFYIDCRRYHKDSPGWPAYSIARVLNEGLVLENTCGKASEQPKAGDLVFYVRPWHWWERILHPG